MKLVSFLILGLFASECFLAIIFNPKNRVGDAKKMLKAFIQADFKPRASLCNF